MGDLRGRAGCWGLRSGLRPSLQAQQPGLNYKDTTFNLFLPLRVYFYECSIIVPITVKPGPVFQVGFLFHGSFYLGF